MTENRVSFKNIVVNQLPDYVKQEFPLISEFLSQYYISQELKSAPYDLIKNINQYVKIDSFTNRYEELVLSGDIVDVDEVIRVYLSSNTEGTERYTDS